jgi:formamidopyrimidine-DNA glycosylase
MADAIREIIMGQALAKVEILGGRYAKNGIDRLDTLSTILPMQVTTVNVKGKFCWIELEKDWYIAITFGMSGGIYYEPTEEILHEYSQQQGKQVTLTEYKKHFHVKFLTQNGRCFYFGDPRRFGTIKISNDRKDLQKKLNKLGPDMLTGPPITDQQFIHIFRSTKFGQKNICDALMKQEAVSGVGNYIKSEVLYQCHINPWACVVDLNDEVLEHLHHAIREIARKAYNGHGASLYTYSGTRREKGSFQDMLRVYGKSIDPEGRPVQVIPEGKSPDNRATHYVSCVQTLGSHRDPSIFTASIPTVPISSVPRTKILIKIKATHMAD